MLQHQPYHQGKAALWLSLLSLLVCLVLSLYFAHERILNTDSSAFFFNLVNAEWPSVAEQRYSSMVPQFFPWLFIKVGASLQWVLHSFSASYILLYLLVFGLIQRILKQEQVAIALVFSLLLGVSHSFYHPVTETHQAIAWSLLFFACLGSTRHKTIKLSIAIPAFLLALFAHPAAVFMLAFALVWHVLQTQNYQQYWAFILVIVLAIFSVLRSKLNEGNYDAAQYQNLFEAIKQWKDFFKWNSISFMVQRPHLYIWPILLFGLSTAYFVQKRAWLLAGFLGVSILGFTALAAATFYHGDSQMMMEKAYMPTFSMLAMGASSLFIGQGIYTRLLTWFLLAFLGFSLWQINFVGHKEFRPRLMAIDKLVKDCIAKQTYKVYSLQPLAPNVWRGYWWATAADVLMRSTIVNGKSVTLYLANADENLIHAKESDAFLYTNWWRDRKVSELNPRYFSFLNQPYDTINLSTYEY